MRDSPMIAEETRRLVREAMRESGYVRNVTAASLRTGKTRIVGVSFHNIAHQFFAEMLIAIEDTLVDGGAAVFLNNHGEDPESLSRFVGSLAAYGAEGLIVSPPPDVDVSVLAPIKQQATPVVYVSRRIVQDDTSDWVVNADYMAMRRAAGRLIELGHRNIALIGGEAGTSISEDRSRGFRDELEAHGISWSDKLWCQCRPRLIEGATAARQTLSWPERPTGYVGFNDLVAFGTMNAMRSAGIEPGRDAGVVAVGGTEEASAFFPALTTVHNNPREMGKLAAEILLERLEHPNQPLRQVVLDPKLVIRASCGGPVASAQSGSVSLSGAAGSGS